MILEYNKVAKIDGETIYADKNGYFLFEHLKSAGKCYHSIPVRLGKTAKEVVESLYEYNDWYYRAWHGEMSYLLKAQEEVRKLPDIQ